MSTIAAPTNARAVKEVLINESCEVEALKLWSSDNTPGQLRNDVICSGVAGELHADGDWTILVEKDLRMPDVGAYSDIPTGHVQLRIKIRHTANMLELIPAIRRRYSIASPLEVVVAVDI